MTRTKPRKGVVLLMKFSLATEKAGVDRGATDGLLAVSASEGRPSLF